MAARIARLLLLAWTFAVRAADDDSFVFSLLQTKAELIAADFAGADASSGSSQHVALQEVSADPNPAPRIAPVTSAHGSTTPYQSEMLGGYCASLLVMILVVAAMFHHMGWATVCQVVLYVSCLAFVKIAMKEVYGFGFHYPKFVTALHLLASSTAAFLVLFHRRQSAGKPIAIPTWQELCFGILPIALAFGLSIGSENSALVFVSAAFSEVVAAANPVMSAFLTWVCGMSFHLKLLMPIGVVVVGCAISVSGELYFSAFGLAMLLFSVFCRGLKAVMQQKLMTGETKDKFDPFTLMAWTCLYSFLEMAAYSVATEGYAPVAALQNGASSALVIAIVSSTVIACTLNISALFVIRQLGAVGMQIVSQMKSLLVVIGGIALLSEAFTRTQQFGFLTILGGVYWYSSLKRQLEPNAKGH